MIPSLRAASFPIVRVGASIAKDEDDMSVEEEGGRRDATEGRCNDWIDQAVVYHLALYGKGVAQAHGEHR